MSSLYAGDGVDHALEELISDTSLDVTSTSIEAGAQQAQAVLNPPAAAPLEDEAPAKAGPARFRMGSQDPRDRTRGFSPYSRPPRHEAPQKQTRTSPRHRAMQLDGPPPAEARAPAVAVAQATAVQEAAASSGIGSAQILAFLRDQAAAQAQRDQHVVAAQAQRDQQIVAAQVQREEALQGQLQLMQQALNAQQRDALTQGQAIDAGARSVV